MPNLTAAQSSLADQINSALPQTQCTKCGYQGCRPYAEAIATGEAINRCPPGGPETITLLSAITGQAVQLLNPSVGEHAPLKMAVIREDECIGCTKCIQACPVDAIVGAAKRMHTVIAAECTGCDLCVEPCPVDCIDMITIAQDITAPSRGQAHYWQTRYQNRQSRLQRDAATQEQRRLVKLENKLGALARGESIQKVSTDSPQSPEQMRSYIEAAVARAQARKAALQFTGNASDSNSDVTVEAASRVKTNE
jgi:Na+-translocating ferredoxin:NAD+ oxidoreductase subunit B